MRQNSTSQRSCGDEGPSVHVRGTQAASPRQLNHSASDPVRPLRQEIDQLRQAMSTRPIIDMARGILMARFGCSAATAWEILVKVSQRSNTKLRDVAERLVEAAQSGGQMPQSLRQHLSSAVQEAQREPPPLAGRSPDGGDSRGRGGGRRG
ncbi:ANTAR domain-containing protein [Streptomyces collinus]|uniref:ANTAR domain-containing response regulator n=1 Tax=Streptomyces collinus TaxID=42684 RepID=UPI0033DBE49C